ncbi:hypothetical protein ACWKSP_02175 [Micromonosporaceae bacterium Da 78-11]
MTAHVRPAHRVREWSWCPWSAVHVVVYLALVAGGAALWELLTGGSVADASFGVLVSLAWYGPWVIGPLVLALVILRALAELRRRWFRLSALLLLAGPPTLFVLLTGDAAAALPIGGLQTAMALLVVQPWLPGPRPDENPAMDRHDW